LLPSFALIEVHYNFRLVAKSVTLKLSRLLRILQYVSLYICLCVRAFECFVCDGVVCLIVTHIERKELESSFFVGNLADGIEKVGYAFLTFAVCRLLFTRSPLHANWWPNCKRCPSRAGGSCTDCFCRCLGWYPVHCEGLCYLMLKNSL
jgi:hypothetical protein